MVKKPNACRVAWQEAARKRVCLVLDRKFQGNQSELARALGVHRALVSIVSRKVQPPTKDLMARLGTIPGINPRWAVDGDGEPFVDHRRTVMPGTISSPCLYDVLYKHIQAIRAGAKVAEKSERNTDLGDYCEGKVHVCDEILRFMTTIEDMVIAPVPPPPPEPDVCKHCGKVNGCPICSVHPADL